VRHSGELCVGPPASPRSAHAPTARPKDTRGASSANKDAWGVCDPALCTGVSVTTAPSPKPTPAAPTHKPTTAAPTKKPTIANWGFGGYLAEPAPCTQACVLFSKAKPFINSKVAPADPPAGDSKASWCNTGAVPYSASGSGKKSWGYCNPFVATSQPTVAVVVTTQPTSASEPPATDAPSAQPTVAQTSAPTPTDFTGAPSVAMTDAPSVASHTTTSAPVAAPTAMPSLVVIGNGTTSAPSASNSSASFRSASGFVAAACLGAVVAVGA
jgi:hypothetical protein